MSKLVKVLCLAALSVAVACKDKKSPTSHKDSEKAMNHAQKGAMYHSVQSLSKNSFVPDRVFFDFDTSSIDAESRTVLMAQAAELKSALSGKDAKAVIEGNCDEKGGVEYNMALGERRANAAKKFLVQNGVPAEKLEVVSYGKERKIVAGSTPEAYAQNRVAITVVKNSK